MNLVAEAVGELIIGIVEAMVRLLVRAARWLFLAVLLLARRLYLLATQPRARLDAKD